MSNFPLFAVVTIEGGGAYGFNLLGQLQAIVESEIEPVAFAGTSAGAIIATLHWAGYSPAEIKEKFCELADQSELTSLVGPFEKASDGSSFDFKSFENFAGNIRELVSESPQNTPRTGIKHIIGIGISQIGAGLSKLATGTPNAAKYAGLIKTTLPHLKNRGIFTGDTIADKIDTWLRNGPNLDANAQKKLEAMRPRDSKVTFDDIMNVTKKSPLRPLFLPVTNVTERKLELVCSIDPKYANWSIARTVRASAGFPGFFRPASFGHSPDESQYVDGGVIANYPAWIFGHQFRSALYQIESGKEFAIHPWIHVGLCLGSPTHPTHDPERSKTPISFFRNFASLLAGGARHELEQRISGLISRTIEIRQPEDETDAPDNLLEIGKCDRVRITKMYKRGYLAAQQKLNQIDFTCPPASSIEPILERLIQKAEVCFGHADQLNFRVNLFMPKNDKSEDWGITYSARMKGDPDQNLSLPKFAGLTGMCVGLRRPLICNLAEIRKAVKEGRLDAGKLFGMPPDLHQQVREDRNWLGSVPVFDHYASYPARIGEDLRRYEGRQFQELACQGDGAVMGVLNLDASLDYSALTLNPDPEIHWTDVRIQAIIDLMRAAAHDLGAILSVEFSRPKSGVEQ